VRILLYSNLFIALAAGVLTLGSFFIIHQVPDLWLCAWVSLASFCVYTAQRLMKLRAYAMRADQMAWVARHRKTLVYGSGISLLLSFILGMKMSWDLLWSLWPVVIISMLYALPFIPSGGEKKALREVPGIKIFLIATVWTFITLLLPMKASGIAIGAFEQSLLIERFCFILAITIPFDIRDLDHDSKDMHTLPQLMGVNGSIIFAIALLFFAIIIEHLGIYEGHIETHTAALTSSVYALCIALLWTGKKPRPYWYYNGLLDGMIMLLGALLIYSR
jgi:hypothetical protein